MQTMLFRAPDFEFLKIYTIKMFTRLLELNGAVLKHFVQNKKDIIYAKGPNTKILYLPVGHGSVMLCTKLI